MLPILLLLLVVAVVEVVVVVVICVLDVLLRNADGDAVVAVFVGLPPPTSVNPSHNNTIDEDGGDDAANNKSVNVVMATFCSTEKKDLGVTTTNEPTDVVDATAAAVKSEECEDEDLPAS